MKIDDPKYETALAFAYGLAGEIMPERQLKYPVGQMEARLENTFTYHKPKEHQPERYEMLRAKAKELAYLIVGCVPPSREQSLALTDLEHCIFNANAGIARNE